MTSLKGSMLKIALINHSSFKHSIKISVLFITKCWYKTSFYEQPCIWYSRRIVYGILGMLLTFCPNKKKSKQMLEKNTSLIFHKHIKTYRHGVLCTLCSFFYCVVLGNGGNARSVSRLKKRKKVEKNKWAMCWSVLSWN